MPDKDIVSKQLVKRLLVGFGIRLFELDIAEAELLSGEQQRVEDRRADLVARIKDSEGASSILHVEIQNDNQSNMPLRMLRYYSDIALEYPNEKIVQHLIYTGRTKLTMPNKVHGPDWSYRYKILDMRSQDSDYFLSSNNPDALVLAILCDPQGVEPRALVDRIIKKLRRLHGPKLDSLRDSLKMLDILASNRDLQNIVRENDHMLVEIEKLGSYQLGLERGLESRQQEIVLNLLSRFTPEQAAEFSGVPLARVKAIAEANASQ